MNGGHNSTNIVLAGTGVHQDTPEGRQMWDESGERFLGEGAAVREPDAKYPGTVRAELLDEDQKAIPGYTLDECLPFCGDEVRGPMRWKSRDNVAELQGDKVHVRFCIDMATIYAYIFT